MLQQVDNIKYLGIIISIDLSWSPHIDYVTNKANRVVDLLRRSFNELKQIAYFSMLKSMLEYASAVREEQQDLSKITTGSTLK